MTAKPAGSGTPPPVVAASFIAYQASDFTDAAAGEATASISWNSGDLIYVYGLTADNAITYTGVPGATGLTFSQVTAISGASDCRAYLWLATAGSGGSSTVTATGTANRKGLGAFVIRGSAGTGNTATQTPGANNKTISLIRGFAQSVVIVGLADWAAINDTAVNAIPTGTIRTAVEAGGDFTSFIVSFGDQGAAGTTAYGITDHTGTVDMIGIAAEIKGL